MARISPPEMTSQFFALFGLSSTVTLFLGPLLVATITDITGYAVGSGIPGNTDYRRFIGIAFRKG